MCARTPLLTRATPSPTLSLPVLGDERSVLHGARGALTAGLAAGFRPQLFLKFLDHLLQVLPGLPLMQEVGAELLAVGLGVLQLHLQVLNLWGQDTQGCGTGTGHTGLWDKGWAQPGPPHTPGISRHRISKIEVRKEFPVPVFHTLLQYSACLALKPKHSQ